MEQLQTGITIFEQLLVGFIISAAVIYALKGANAGISYLRSKESLISDDKARKLFDNALNDLQKLIITNIESAETTLKPQILLDIADGKVTKDELKTLSGIVKDKVLKQFGDSALQVLNSNLGDVNSYASEKIETTLSKLKDDPTSVVEHTVIPEVSTVTADNTELQNKNVELADANNQLIKTNAQLQGENLDLKAKIDQINSTLNPVTPDSNITAAAVQA